MSTEAEAFAAGYAAAIKVLKLAKAREDGWSGCGVGRIASEYSGFAIGELERSQGDVDAWFQSWQLRQDTDFQDALEQLQQGDDHEIRLDESDAWLKAIDPLSTVNMNKQSPSNEDEEGAAPNHWSYWTR